MVIRESGGDFEHEEREAREDLAGHQTFPIFPTFLFNLF
jgi:hypothetical protein